MSYNILILDDDQDRLVAFKRILSRQGDDLTMVSTATDAISMLKLYVYPIVFLDYDLDLQQSLDIKETGTGMDVVDWIVKNKAQFQRTHFIVHSLNPVYGPLMYTTLKTAGLQALLKPGVWTDKAFLSAL